MNSVYQFFSGLVTMEFLVIGLFFFRFWKKTSDRLFGIFGIAFWIMALERIVILLLGFGNENESHALVYVFRLLAFLMILTGIIDKNKANGTR